VTTSGSKFCNLKRPRRRALLNRRDLVKTGGLAAGAVVLVGLSAKESVAQRNPSIEALQIVTNGLAFDALTCGPSTGELVLLLHGFPAYKETWTAVLQGLGALGYYAVAPDQRGYSVGARPDSPSEYVLANLVSDVVGFAEFLNAKKFHLVGHDMGGTVGWAVAAQHGDQLLSTTILSTPH
jgi:pimeloyl-ACP methyl ester carboxylesterase